MPIPLLIPAAIAAASGIAKAISGGVNSAKTKKIAKELERTRPEYEISELAKDDLSLAESELSSGGLSSTALNAYNNLNNKQFSSSLGAILRGGGSVNNVADVFGETEDGRLRLALMSDQMRLNQINNVMKAREMYREQQDKEFQINKFAPWKDKQVANAQARQQAQNQLWGGIDTVAGAAMSYFGAKANQSAYNKSIGQLGSGVGSVAAGTEISPQQFGRPNMNDINSTYQFNPYESPMYNNVSGRYVRQRPQIDYSYNPQF